MNEVRSVSEAVLEEFKKAQKENLSTQDFWDRVAKAAIEKLDVVRGLNRKTEG